MENQSFDHNVEHNGDQCQEIIEITTVQEVPHLLDSQSRKQQPESRWRHRISKVPPQLRLRGQKKGNEYDPEMVSLGPYHHGKPELQQAEKFKGHCLDWCTKGNEKKIFFLIKILEKIDVIRECYAETMIVNNYDDSALAWMMLLDACFIINYMSNVAEIDSNYMPVWLRYLGIAATDRFIFRDIMVLENQIPFFVIKMLTSLLYEENEERELFGKFLSWITFVDPDKARLITGENIEEQPIHLVEACWRVLVNEHNTEYNKHQLQWPSFIRKKMVENNVVFTSRSVMDLKAKGIHFRPSSSHYVKDITFKSNPFSGQLQLPVRYASEKTHVLLSNMIAYEVSPNSQVRPFVLSYTNFMKALIKSPEDAKNLQEKGILLNRFINHEQVVEMFKEIDTFGLLEIDVFMDVKRQIEDHCSNKAKTWMADLIYTRFRTPWTAIAFFAAALLLCLTFLQTFFTIHPVKQN